MADFFLYLTMCFDYNLSHTAYIIIHLFFFINLSGSLVYIHTWATEFPRVWVWVRVGYPQPTIYPRQLKNSGVQPTIYPTTDFLKHLILSYSFEIKLNTCRNNRNFISIHFKAKCQSKCKIYMQILNYL